MGPGLKPEASVASSELPQPVAPTTAANRSSLPALNWVFCTSALIVAICISSNPWRTGHPNDLMTNGEQLMTDAIMTKCGTWTTSAKDYDFLLNVVVPDGVAALTQTHNFKLNRGAETSSYILRKHDVNWYEYNPYFSIQSARRNWSRSREDWEYRREVIWVNDKIAIKCTVDSIDQGITMPHIASAYFSNQTAMQQLLEIVRRLFESGEFFVLKCSHGANSDCILRVGRSQVENGLVNVSKIKKFVKKARDLRPVNWDHWIFHNPDPGLVVSRVYDSAIDGLTDPMEIKVQTMWGRVVGATVWIPQVAFKERVNSENLAMISANGTLYLWEGMIKCPANAIFENGMIVENSTKKCPISGSENATRKRQSQKRWAHLFARLEIILKADWSRMRNISEYIAQRAGLDELRVDWFVGSPSFGTVLNEITYVGSVYHYCPVQYVFTFAFLGGYEDRIRKFKTATKFDLPSSCRNYDFHDRG